MVCVCVLGGEREREGACVLLFLFVARLSILRHVDGEQWPVHLSGLAMSRCLLDVNLNLSVAARHHLCTRGNEFRAFTTVGR